VRGLAFKENGDILQTPPRELVADIDNLPFPAWHLLELERYSLLATGGRCEEKVFAILSSRGCPNQCTFCDSHSVFGRHFRGRSARNICAEIVYMVDRFGARQFDFIDDTLTIDKKRVLELCALIINEGLDINWMCNARVNTVDEDMLFTMREAGCVRIEFGVESGDQEVLKKMKKGITIEQVKQAHKMARNAGMSIGTFVMVGNLGENWDSIRKTEEVIASLETDDVYISIATPFPGTELYRTAKQEGLLLTKDWNRYVTSPTYLPKYQPVMKTDLMEPADILKAFYYLHSRFATRKFITRYGWLFFLKPKFYQQAVFGSGGLKGAFHRLGMGIKIALRMIGRLVRKKRQSALL